MRRKRKSDIKKSTNLVTILVIGGIFLISWVLYHSLHARNILGVTVMEQYYISPTPQQIIQPTQSTVGELSPTQSYMQILPTIPQNISPTPQPSYIIIYSGTITVPIGDLGVDTVEQVLPVTTSSLTSTNTNDSVYVQQSTQTQDTSEATLNDQQEDVIQDEALLVQPLLVQTVDQTETVKVEATDIINIENNDQQISVNLEDSDGNTTELAFTTFEKVRNRLISDDISVYTSGNKEFLIQTDQVGVLTTFPISVTLTNDLIANTKELGPVHIDIKGSRALEYAKDTATATDVKVRATNNASINQVVRLIVYDNKLAYEFEGCKGKYVFAIVPAEVCGTVFASAHAENEIFAVYRTPFNAILDRISI